MKWPLVCCTALSIAWSGCQTVETSAIEQPGIQLQGIQLQGIQLQGIQLQGMSMQGFRLSGATFCGDPLTNVRVQQGEVVAKHGSTTLRGAALVGAHFLADAENLDVSPPASAVIEFRVTAVTTEDPKWDPTNTGHTLLYTLEQFNTDTASWQPACSPDADGNSVAIPLNAIWNEHGDRVESTSQFTFGCTTGVIAKCYRWGYRPWVDDFGDLVAMHETCTRLARADYCGIGRPATRDGTEINVWDNLPPPGPIQRHGLPPLGMLFEAGWNTGGAVCLSHSRWLLDDTRLLVDLCPDRLVPPGLLGTVCDTVSDVLDLDPNARMFDDAFLNLIGP